MGDYIESVRSPQNWVERMIMTILFNEHLNETVGGLYNLDIESILKLNEEIDINTAIQRAWEVDAEKKNK